jgi:uncharacterized membrane protein YcaP (DUF421 family)
MMLLQIPPPPVSTHPPFFFNGWYYVGRTVTLSIIGFLALIIMLRLSGKRTLSKLNVFDFVFVVAIGSLFAASIIDKSVTLIEGVAGVAALIVVQIVLAEMAARSALADRVINGRPTLLFSHGKFIPKALKRQRLTEGEVRGAIREQGVKRIEDVDAVVLENDGSLTAVWEGEGRAETSLVDANVPKGARRAKGRRT